MLSITQHGHYLRYPEDVSRDYSRDMLKAWRDETRARLLAFAKAEYAKTPYSYIADFDTQGFDNALTDALSDATFDAWGAIE